MRRRLLLGFGAVVLAMLALLPAGAAPGGGLPGSAAQAPARIGDADSMTLPNLVPLPPYDVFVGVADQPTGPVWSSVGVVEPPPPPGRPALRFTTTIVNRGRYALEIVGSPWVPDPSDPDLATSQAYQCVRFSGPPVSTAQRECVRYDAVGTLTWHAQHHHLHIDGFGRYELRRDAGGRPDMSQAGLRGTAEKVGWCVSDMYNVRHDQFAGPLAPGERVFWESGPAGWYSECSDPLLYSGASWRQGISPGWSDTYPAYYTGQEIPLRGVTDGMYWIVTTINPKDNPYGLRIAETIWTDNTSASRVQIYGGGKKARLLSPMPGAPYGHWYHNPPDQPGE